MRSTQPALLSASVLLVLACGSAEPAPEPGIGAGAMGATGSGATGSGGTIVVGSGGSGIVIPPGGGTGGVVNNGPWMLPAGFTPATKGGWQLGEEITADSAPMGGSGGGGGTGGSGGASGSSGAGGATGASGSAGSAGSGGSGENGTGCGALIGIVRDFNGKDAAMMPHPDFQAFDGDPETKGMVGTTLGADLKPTYTGICQTGGEAVTDQCPEGQQTTTEAAFNQWYRGDPTVNKAYILRLAFEPDGTGIFTFDSNMFFPLDNTGLGNTEGEQHNFGFTTEVHTEFKYNGGEIFTFTGDDDLWVFINKKLAIDLGGLHPAATATINLDMLAGEFGITPGNFYTLDLFHAERSPSASNFRVDTSLDFVNCGYFVPDVPK